MCSTGALFALELTLVCYVTGEGEKVGGVNMGIKLKSKENLLRIKITPTFVPIKSTNL